MVRTRRRYLCAPSSNAIPQSIVLFCERDRSVYKNEDGSFQGRLQSRTVVLPTVRMLGIRAGWLPAGLPNRRRSSRNRRRNPIADYDDGKRKLEQWTVDNMCRVTVYPIEFKVLCHGTMSNPAG